MFEAAFWLVVKHFVCDYPLQAMPYQYKNKGTYGHPGGLLHASIHVLGTAVVLWFFVGAAAILWALADGIAHYHIDYAKVRICAHFGLQPNNSEWYWIILGFDQLLHYVTYFGIVWFALP
jgi:hypothetical protein